MTDSPSSWSPYVVQGTTHAGVLINEDMERDEGKTFLARIEPDGHTHPHTHSGQETIEILEGTAEVRIHHETILLRAGESCVFPSGVLHSVRNRTAEVLLLRAHFDPPFRRQTTTLK